MNTQSKYCPQCGCNCFDIEAPALARMCNGEIKFTHSPEINPRAICTCQGCEQTFPLDHLLPERPTENAT